MCRIVARWSWTKKILAHRCGEVTLSAVNDMCLDNNEAKMFDLAKVLIFCCFYKDHKNDMLFSKINKFCK